MTALDIAPDGRILATGTSSGIVRQYDIATHDTFGPALRGHSSEVGGVAYSPDGAMLASTALGLSTTRLWDAATGTSIGDELTPGRTPFTERTVTVGRQYYSHSSRPAFSVDGRTLFTPVVDGLVMAWDLRPTSWVRAACSIAGRNLTRAEWRQHVGDAKYDETCNDL